MNKTLFNKWIEIGQPDKSFDDWIENTLAAAEAQRDELKRSIDGICEFYGTLSIVAAVATMHTERKQRDELAAERQQWIARLQAYNEIEKANKDLASEVRRLAAQLGEIKMLLNATDDETTADAAARIVDLLAMTGTERNDLAAQLATAQVNNWILLSVEVPDPNHLVWCKRKTGQIYLAYRHDMPISTRDHEPWSNCYWYGRQWHDLGCFSNNTLHNFSDVTVESWKKLTP